VCWTIAEYIHKRCDLLLKFYMMKDSRANLSLTAVQAQQMSGGLTATCDDNRNFRGSIGFDRGCVRPAQLHMTARSTAAT